MHIACVLGMHVIVDVYTHRMPLLCNASQCVCQGVGLCGIAVYGGAEGLMCSVIVEEFDGPTSMLRSS